MRVWESERYHTALFFDAGSVFQADGCTSFKVKFREDDTPALTDSRATKLLREGWIFLQTYCLRAQLSRMRKIRRILELKAGPGA